MAKEIEELEGLTTEENFWLDKENCEKIFNQISKKKKMLESWNSLYKQICDYEELALLLKETDDEDEVIELNSDVKSLAANFTKAEISLLMNEEYDGENCILAIHAGTGGVDAQDWAEMLMRMYARYAEKKNLKSEIMSITSGEEAGIKSVTILIKGTDAYGFLKSESGVHRLVRQSPFNAKSLRQTSFALVEVVPFLEKEIELEIDKDDLKIDTYRSSGHGGQNVNTTDSAVRITHLPSGLVVTCQNERSQLQNKETAMKILKAKLYAQKKEELEKKEQAIKGESRQGSWGNQIRSYVMHPYKMVKDHRTDCETSDVDSVMDGELEDFVEAYLRWHKMV